MASMAAWTICSTSSLDIPQLLEEEYRRECAAHAGTRRLALRLGLVAAALLVISILVTWRLFT